MPAGIPAKKDEHLTNQEIADRLGISVKTAENQTMDCLPPPSTGQMAAFAVNRGLCGIILGTRLQLQAASAFTMLLVD